MKIAIDISPLRTDHFLQHRVRGVGFYIGNLKKSLLQYFPNNTYTFFVRGENLSKDIDLVHYPYFEPFFLTLPLRKHFPTVVTVHDLTPLVFPNYFPAGIRGNAKWRIQKLSLEKAGVVITDSGSSKKDIVTFTNISEQRIHVVYLATSEEFKPVKDTRMLAKIKEKYGLPEKFILSVGDVTWNKNLPRLIEAVKKTDFPFVMVGKALIKEEFDRTNPWNQDLIRVKELIKDDRKVALLGFVPTDDLVALYNLATVFVMPSLYEGFGLPILEAMACGCPVITAKSGSLPEVAGEAGLYVDPYDTESIAQGIVDIFLNSKLQKTFSQKGLKQVEKFSWKKTAQETVRVYEEVASKNS